MKKMIKSKNTQKTILKKNTYAINDRHIEHFDYSLNKIVYNIESRNINVVNFVKTLKYSKKIVLSFEKKMMFLIWNHMIKKEKIQQKIIDRITKIKQRMKKKYNRNVQFKIFVIDQYVFFRNNNLIFDKNVFRWNEFFVISEFDEKQNFNYKLKNLKNKSMFNFFHDDHLKIFRKRIEYLQSINEKILSIMKNLRKIRTKMIKKTNKKKQKKKVFEKLIEFEFKI